MDRAIAIELPHSEYAFFGQLYLCRHHTETAERKTDLSRTYCAFLKLDPREFLDRARVTSVSGMSRSETGAETLNTQTPKAKQWEELF